MMKILVPKELYIRISACNLIDKKCEYIKVIDTTIEEAAKKINKYLTGIDQDSEEGIVPKNMKITLREFNKKSGNGKQWSKAIVSCLTEKQIISYLKNKINEENAPCVHPGSINCANDFLSTIPKTTRTNSY